MPINLKGAMNRPFMVRIIHGENHSFAQPGDLLSDQMTWQLRSHNLKGAGSPSDLEPCLFSFRDRPSLGECIPEALDVRHFRDYASFQCLVFQKNRTLETKPPALAGVAVSGPHPHHSLIRLSFSLPSWPDMVIPTGATSGARSIKSHFEFSPCRRIIALTPFVRKTLVSRFSRAVWVTPHRRRACNSPGLRKDPGFAECM
jgi:hypothetical protein